MRKTMTRRSWLTGLGGSLVLLPLFSGSAFASTTPGSLTLSSTFEAISVRASFSGDPNGNNSATIQFRRQGDSIWKNALAAIVDRRTSISGRTNPWVNQARGSVVGLQPGTTYEVALTFSDPDGIVGTATLTGTVATIAATAPVSGAELFVDAGAASGGNGSSGSPFNSITAAISAATAGTTIHVRPGAYPAFSISKSGNASGYIAIVGDARDQVFINGNSANNIGVSGSFIQLKNLRLRQSNNNSINVQSGSHHIWIENIYHENISASRSYNDAGVAIGDNTHNIYVLSNEFYSASLTNFDIPGNAWDQAGAAIYINASPNPIGTFVFKNNIISAGFRDCIGNAVESWGNGTVDNSDIAYNYVTGCKDDGIQMEGDDVNLRIFGNVIDATGWSCIANEVALVGPVYIFRNFCRLHGSHAGYAFKLSGSPGFAFYIHNTIDTTGGAGSDGWGGGGSKPLQFIYNNIIRTSGIGLDAIGTTNGCVGSINCTVTSNVDSNLYLCNSTYFNSFGGTSYSSVTALRSATGQEVHGKQGDPLFIDANRRISSTSPAYNAGIVIPNFNSQDSAWPYLGSAPDIGAYEVGSETQMPSPPTTLLLR